VSDGKGCGIRSQGPEPLEYWRTVGAHNGRWPISNEAKGAKESNVAVLIGACREHVVSLEIEFDLMCGKYSMSYGVPRGSLWQPTASGDQQEEPKRKFEGDGGGGTRTSGSRAGQPVGK